MCVREQVCCIVLHIIPVEDGPLQHTSLPSQSADSAATSCAALIEQPGYPSKDKVLLKCDHVLSYNNMWRIANWVFEVCVCVCACVCACVCVFDRQRSLRASSLQVLTQNQCYTKIANRRYSSFRLDEQVSEPFQSDNEDYKESSFDRGHLAAAANHSHSQRAMNDTFLFSNISPQVLA